MKISQVKINGIHNPMGFSYPYVSISWKVTDTLDKRQTDAKIEVSTEADFSRILYEKQGADLCSAGERVVLASPPRCAAEVTVTQHVGAQSVLVLRPMTRYYCRVSVWGDGGDFAVSEPAYFETALMDAPWQGAWIGTRETDKFHPIFFRDFKLEQRVHKARLYMSGLGLYEARLNGKKVGDEYLAPFCNDYHWGIQYQTYDVTELLSGENLMEIYTGNGWYKGRFGFNKAPEQYGSRFAAIAQLHVTFDDGSCAVIGTDAHWRYKGSDIVMSDIYDGEVYDHTWWDGKENPERPVELLPMEERRLVERYSLPVTVKESLKVRQVIHTSAGETVLDMGQNFAGYMEFFADLPRGTRIVLDFGEILQQGNFYNGNYGTARSQFVYVAGDGPEVVRPHFTYYGFRYVRVTGWPGTLDPADFTGRVVYSDLDGAVDFFCSDERLNRLYANVLWGQRSNFVDMPTDCPQRDERLGWTGDAQVFAPTACFNMDTRAFYRKFLFDLAHDQRQNNGMIANFVPNIGAVMPCGASVWGDCATFLPMTLYDFYGNVDDLAIYYPMMKDWVDFIIREDEAHGGSGLWNFGFHFGDWLALDGVTPRSMKGGTDEGLIASVYYYVSCKKTARAAQLLGRTEDAERYEKQADLVRQAILQEYFSPNGRLTVDTQTAYYICLKFEVYVSKEKVLEGLRVRLKKDCYRIRSGFVGATMMCSVLAENGFEALACELLLQEGFPGWMHCVRLGATTVWERWNSVLDDGSINPVGMNSLNHYAYGSVMEYVYKYIAGITPTAPGFASVRFAPQPSPHLNRVSLAYDSVRGCYVSRWKVHEDGTVTVHFEVPFNCTATAILPGTGGETVALEAGVFERTYRPDRDYRQLYTMASRLMEMKDDPRAMEILKSDLPAAYGMIMANDIENMCMDLGELQYAFFMGFNPPMVQQAAEKLMKLRG